MLIASMNQKSFPNILVVMTQPDVANQVTTEKQSIVRISDQADQTIGYNFLAIDQLLPELQFKRDPSPQCCGCRNFKSST